MAKVETGVHARFISPSHHHRNLLRQTPLPLIAALNSIYPFLVASNRILADITWTNNAYYRNTALILLMSMTLLHWNTFLTILIPLFIATTFCCYAWFIKTSFIDFNVDNEVPPTIEEILDTLDNFTARFSFAFDSNERPISTLHLLTNLCLLTPFYVIIMRNLVSPITWIVFVLIFLSTYFSTWCIAIRRLLWRSKTVRKLIEILTGNSFPNIDKDLELSILNMTTKGSVDGKTQIIEFQVEENERRWIGFGWTKKMLFTDTRCAYYDRYSQKGMEKLEDFTFPVLKSYPHSEWRWVDSHWRPATGWIYTDNWWRHPKRTDSVSAFTRSRRLKRECVVIPRA